MSVNVFTVWDLTWLVVRRSRAYLSSAITHHYWPSGPPFFSQFSEDGALQFLFLYKLEGIKKSRAGECKRNHLARGALPADRLFLVYSRLQVFSPTTERAYLVIGSWLA